MRRLALRLLTTTLAAAALVGCQTAPPAGLISPGPAYTGEAAVARLYVYVFADTRPEFMHPAFRKAFEQRLQAALDAAGVPSRQLWFMDTAQGQRLSDDRKASTMVGTILVEVGRTIQENARDDTAFGPTHRLTIFPTGTRVTGRMASMELKWDVLDARTGNYEWSVYARTPDIGQSMGEGAAVQAAQGAVDAVVREMRAKGVLKGG